MLPYGFRDDIDGFTDRLSPQQKARLTTWIIDQRTQGVKQPMITKEVIEYVKAKHPFPVHERADRLLRYLVNSTDITGEFVTLGTLSNTPDSYGHRGFSEGSTFWEVMAWSESIKDNEVEFFLDYLLEKGWVKGRREGIGMGQFAVTIDGYSHIADVSINRNLSQVFVAMWFDDMMRDAFDKGIEPAILQGGYNPLRIDRKEHINKIDDEIVAEIRRSRFLVADFTQASDGARGGVYYEAGFAHGLGLPVIFTCRQDAVDKLHFDTNHYNHIVWATPGELREKLKNRILAAIGEGPGIGNNP